MRGGRGARRAMETFRPRLCYLLRFGATPSDEPLVWLMLNASPF
jgi:hypothetical protein